MPKVESKYKNPDKYIQKLKSQNKWLSDRNKNATTRESNNRGSVVVNYTPNTEKEVSVASGNLGSLTPKDKIVIVGKVRKIVKELSSKNEIETHATYELLQVRKMPDRW